jgi:hypothetical protein
MIHPNPCSPRSNDLTRSGASGSSSARFMSTPTRRMRSACCACAASGPAAGHSAVLPSPAINSLRRIRHPPKLLCGAAYRGQGRMGTGCISPGGAGGPTSLDLFCSAGGGFWPAAEVSVDTWYIRSLGNSGSSRLRLDSMQMTQCPLLSVGCNDVLRGPTDAFHGEAASTGCITFFAT